MTALAFRAETQAGRDVSSFERMLTFAENGGEPGPPRLDAPMRRRLEGLLVKDNARSDHSIGSKPAHVFTVCIDVRELGLMWALGGSPEWSRARIDGELDACSAALRDLGAVR